MKDVRSRTVLLESTREFHRIHSADPIDPDREIIRTSFESVMSQILCLIDDQYSGLKKVNCHANLKVSHQRIATIQAWWSTMR